MKILLILAISYALFFHGLGATSLWDPDEPRQAIMAKEMMERQDYIHPYLNGKPYLEKPPLYPWMIVLASRIHGKLDEFSSRVPAAFSALCLMIVTFYLGRLLVDPAGGLISASILATNFMFLTHARESVMDMTFASFIGLTILLNYLALKKDRPWFFFLSFLPSSLAILAKGPAGLVISAGTTFLYMVVEKKWKRFLVPLIAGCLVSCAIASVWFLMAGEEYWKEFIFRQNITRYTNAFDHGESLFYYFPKLFINFLPWTILLPFSLYHAWKRKLWLPLIWFVLTFIFFELSKSKRAVYLLSLFPAIALLCGVYLREKWSWLLETRPWNHIVRGAAIILAILPVAAFISLVLLPYPSLSPFKEKLGMILIFMSTLFLIGTGSAVVTIRKSSRWAMGLIIAYFVVTGFLYHSTYMPVMDMTKKSPLLVVNALKQVNSQTNAYSYGFTSPGIIYYFGRPIPMLKDIRSVGNIRGDMTLIFDNIPPPGVRGILDEQFLLTGNVRYEKSSITVYTRKGGL